MTTLYVYTAGGSTKLSDQMPVMGPDGHLVRDRTKQAKQVFMDHDNLKWLFGIGWVPKDKILRFNVTVDSLEGATCEKSITVGEFGPLGAPPSKPAKFKVTEEDDEDDYGDEDDDF